MYKNKTTIVSEALYYAELGFQIFPCHSIKNGKCTCGDKSCKFPSAHPRIDHAIKNATRDEKLIREYWRKWPDANVGFPTGKISGLVAIEIWTNPDKNWEDVLYELHLKDLALPVCGIGSDVRLVNGEGEIKGKRYRLSQLYYRCTKDILESVTHILKNNNIERMNFKGENDFTILPPSAHPDGFYYEWDIPFGEWAYLRDLPDWVAKLVRQKNKIYGKQ